MSRSPYRIGRLSHTDETERAELADLCQHWSGQLDQAGWTRAVQGFENFSFLCGNPFTRFFHDASVGLGMHRFGIDDKSVHDSIIAQIADNRLVRPTEKVISMLTRSMPSPRVTPASDTPAAEDVAKWAGVLLEDTAERPLNMPEVQYESALVMALFGTVIAETEYGDTDLYAPSVTPRVRRKKNPLFGKLEGAPEFVETPIKPKETAEPEQDYQCHVLTPYHFDADPAATNERNAVWFRKTTLEDREWVEESYDRKEEGFYPEGLKGMQSAEPGRSPLYWYSRMSEVIDSPQSGNGRGLAPLPMRSELDSSQVPHEVFDVKPTRQFPSGRTIIFAGGNLVYCGDARSWSERYKWRWHPYSFAHWFKLVGRFFGIAPMTLAVALQKRINAIDALFRFNRTFMSIGQWAIAKQSKVKPGTITGIAGQHIEYTAVPNVPAPQKVEHRPLPAELIVEREKNERAIDDIFASGTVASQVTGSAARAGSIFEFFRGENLESKAPMIGRYQAYIEGIFQNVLIDTQVRAVRFDKRLVARLNQLGKDRGLPPITRFASRSLRDHHVVKVDIVGAIMSTPEAEQERAGMALQYAGQILDRNEVLGLLRGMGLGKFLTGVANASMERARRMIEFAYDGMEEGTIPYPRIDQPMLMAPVFQSEILSVRFAASDDEAAKSKILEMFDYYAAAAAEEAQRMMAMQAQQQPAKGGERKAA